MAALNTLINPQTGQAVDGKALLERTQYINYGENKPLSGDPNFIPGDDWLDGWYADIQARWPTLGDPKDPAAQPVIRDGATGNTYPVSMIPGKGGAAPMFTAILNSDSGDRGKPTIIPINPDTGQIGDTQLGPEPGTAWTDGWRDFTYVAAAMATLGAGAYIGAGAAAAEGGAAAGTTAGGAGTAAGSTAAAGTGATTATGAATGATTSTGFLGGSAAGGGFAGTGYTGGQLAAGAYKAYGGYNALVGATNGSYNGVGGIVGGAVGGYFGGSVGAAAGSFLGSAAGGAVSDTGQSTNANGGNVAATSNLLGTGAQALVSYQAGQQALDAQTQLYNNGMAVANDAANKGKFTPYGVSTDFGQTTYDAAGNQQTNLTPQLQALGGQAAGQVAGAGNQLSVVNYDPSAYAQDIYNKYKASTVNSQNDQFSSLQNRLSQQGLLGLQTYSDGQSGTSTNPFYKDFASGVALQDNTAYNNALGQSNSMYSNLLGTQTAGNNTLSNLNNIQQGMATTSTNNSSQAAAANLAAAKLPLAAALGGQDSLAKVQQSVIAGNASQLKGLIGDSTGQGGAADFISKYGAKAYDAVKSYFGDYSSDGMAQNSLLSGLSDDAAGQIYSGAIGT